MKNRICISLIFLFAGLNLQAQTRHLISANPLGEPGEGIEVRQTPLPTEGLRPARIPQDEGFNTEGTEFWVTFLQNYEYNASGKYLKMQLVFSSRNAANITVSNPNTGWSTSTSVKANGVTIIAVPTVQCYNYGSDLTQNTGLLIQATAPISVYGANFADYTFDATNVVPTSSLGTDYIIQAYRTQREGNTEFAVVATENNTQVTMVLSAPTLNRKKGTYTFTLNRGQVYQVTAEADKGSLAGSVIKADKPVAVFNGDIDLYIPDYKGYSDHVVEQAMPVQTWGRKFVLTKSQGQTTDYVMFTALKDGTKIMNGGSTLATINTCESYLYKLSDAAVYIETSDPCACYIYQSSRTANSSRVGDPSMVWVTPQEQGIKQITFATFKTSVIRYHYMNVVVPTSAAGSMTFNGAALTGFKTVPGNAEYSYLTKKIDHGTYTLYNSDAEFTAHVYGMGVDESYAYCVGGYLREINDVDIDDIIEQVSVEQTFDICEGQSVTIGGKQYSTNTTFSETVGDQIKTYTVVVHQSFLKEETREFRQGTSFIWHGQTISKPGTYKDEHLSRFGCDSIYKLIAKYDNITLTYDTVCATAFYKFRGESFALPQTGTFPQDYTVKKTEGDWEYHCRLRILPQVEYFTDSYKLEPDEVYDWHGLSISKAGTYTVNLENRFGCDSIVTLTVTQPVNSRTYHTICDGDSYKFGDMTLTQEGVYNQEIKASDGSVKVHQLVLSVETAYNNVINATVCEGEIYEENGFHVSEAGTYYQYLRSINGCDSTVTLNLDVCKPQSRTINDVICSGTTYSKYGFSETAPGTYVRALRNRFGCDSTVTLVLTEAQSYRFEENIKLIDDETRPWHGQTLDRKGTYTASYTTIAGCDSIYIAHVRRVVGLEEEVYDTLCSATTYTYRGHTFDVPVPDSYPYDFVMEMRDKHECKRYRMILTLMGASTTNDSYVLAPHETITFGSQTISGEGVYTEKFTSRFGCDSTVILTVTQPVLDLKYDTVDICSGDVYPFAGKEISRPATYIDSAKVEGKKGFNITQLLLRVHPVHKFVIDKVIQSGQSYKDDNFDENLTGVYHKDFQSVWKCDSTYTLNLTVCSPKSAEITATICEGEVYDQNGFIAYENGDYSRNDLTAEGCDSTTTLHLTVLPPLEPEYEDWTICTGGSYLWQGTVYDHGGTYVTPYTLPDGREGQRVLQLKEVPVYKDTVYATICEGDTYTDYNFNCSVAETYTQQHTSIGGCDSTITLVLTVNKTYDRYINASICEGDTYSEYGITTSVEGDYIRRFETIDGCDSVFHIHVSVNEPSSYTEKAVINYGQSYPWEGTVYKETTYITKNLKNAAGCDSTVVFDLWVNDLITNTVPVTFCEGDSAKIFDTDSIVKTEGIYQRMYKAASGADSLVAYNVEVLRRTYENTVVTINPGESYKWHGTEYSLPVSLRDTLVNAEGCDSVCTFELTLRDFILNDLTEQFCEGGSAILWNDSVVKTAGTYQRHFKTTEGLDSLVRYEVTVLYPSVGPDTTAVVCEEELPFLWYGIACSEAKDYTRKLTNAAGCDSIITLHFSTKTCTVPCTDTSSDTTAVVCEDELPFMWYGISCSEAKDYTREIPNAAGCDSIITLHFSTKTCTVPCTDTSSDTTAVVCVEELPFMWYGISCSEAKDYTRKLTNAAGCDSVITLHFSTRDCEAPYVPLEASLTLLTDTVCADWREMKVQVSVTGGKAARLIVSYPQQEPNRHFLDCTIPLAGLQQETVSVPFAASADTTRYIRPDDYEVLLTVEDDGGTQLTYKASFSVLYPSWIIIQRWNDVLALLNSRYNGGYDFASVTWYRNGVQVQGDGPHNSYIYEGSPDNTATLAFGTPYHASLVRVGETKAICTCPVVPQLSAHGGTRAPALRVVARHGLVSLLTDRTGSYILYDVCGRLLLAGSVRQDDYTQAAGMLTHNLRTHLHAGTYICIFTPDDGEPVTLHFLVPE